MSDRSNHRILLWDSEFFGVRIAQIDAAGFTSAHRVRCLEWCGEQKVGCAYLFAGSGNQEVIDGAIAERFRLVEVRVSLQARSTIAPERAAPAGVVLRSSGESDIPALSAIAREAHRDTRFYVDGRFGVDRCDALYELWIAKSCQGWADHVVVAERAGSPVGYVTCHRSESGSRIGLVGLAPDARGFGIGPLMIADAVRWFAGQGVGVVSVATQSHNAAALKAYQKAGFAIERVDCVFHKWFLSPAP